MAGCDQKEKVREKVQSPKGLDLPEGSDIM